MTQITIHSRHNGLVESLRWHFRRIARPLGLLQAGYSTPEEQPWAEGRRDRAATCRLYRIAEAARWNLPGS